MKLEIIETKAIVENTLNDGQFHYYLKMLTRHAHIYSKLKSGESVVLLSHNIDNFKTLFKAVNKVDVVSTDIGDNRYSLKLK